MRSLRSIKTRRGFHGGPESQAHREIKKSVGLLFILDGWLVFPETRHADLVVCKVDSGGFRMLAVEAELRATSHVLVNIRRDLRSGCQAVLVVAPSQTLCASIAGLVSRALSPDTRRWVVVTTLSEITRAIEQIADRLEDQRQNHTEPPDELVKGSGR